MVEIIDGMVIYQEGRSIPFVGGVCENCKPAPYKVVRVDKHQRCIDCGKLMTSYSSQNVGGVNNGTGM